MTRKDFKLIADVIARHLADMKTITPEEGKVYVLASIADLTDSMADALSTTNANFDRGRFERACGL